MTDDEYAKQRYDDLSKHYDDLGDRQRELRIKQDQLVITLSVATLGFSVSFIKDVVPVVVAQHEALLFVSWLVLIMSVLAVILSITMGTLAHEKQMDKTYDAISKWEYGVDETAFLEEKNGAGWFSQLSYTSHYASPFLLIVGIILNTLFIGLNYTNVQ